MKLFEKVIIIIAVAAGVAGIILVLTFTLAPGGRAEDRSLAPLRVPGEKEALAVYVSGDVFLHRDGRWRPLEIGGTVTAGDHVKTFEKSFCELQIGGRTVIAIQAETSFRLDAVLHGAGGLQTEGRLLFGTVQCKVERLAGSDRVRVSAGAKAFGVRGTEFLVERRAGDIICGVRTGRVAVFADEAAEQPVAVIEAGREAAVDDRTGAVGAPVALSRPRRALLDRLAETSFVDLGAGERLVKVAVEVEPAAAEILLDGAPAGYGTFAGIFPAGTPLHLTLRKSGYVEKSFTLTPRAGDNRSYLFRLDLAGPEAGVSLPDPGAAYEERLRRFEDEVRKMTVAGEALERERDALKKDNARLAAELDDAKRKIRAAADTLK